MSRTMTINHAVPLKVVVDVPTVSVVTGLFTYSIGAAKPTVFFDGFITAKKPVTIAVGTLPAGAEIRLWFGVGGPLKMRYKIKIVFKQQGQVVKDSAFVLADDLDDDGLAFPEETITCE